MQDTIGIIGAGFSDAVTANHLLTMAHPRRMRPLPLGASYSHPTPDFLLRKVVALALLAVGVTLLWA